jgi:hypothetical protein
MFTKLINALLGAFGIIKRYKSFTTKNNNEFMKSLSAGEIILTWSINANFVQGGIQGATNSIIQHALLYVGKTAGNIIRQIYPDLVLKNLKIPKEAQTHEIIEAEGEGVIVSTLDKNLGDNTQMVAYSRSLSTIELLKVLARIYSCVGRPYDVSEFIGDVLPEGLQDTVPNPDTLFVCSSLVAHAYEPIEHIVLPKCDIRRATPRDLNDYLEPNLDWHQSRYNW